MYALTSTDTLRLWEQAQMQRPPERSRALVAAASPGDGETVLRALPLGTCHARILALRRATLGPLMPCEARCPACHEKMEFNVSADGLLENAARARATVDVEHDGTTFTFRPPTLGDVLDAQHHDDPEAFLARRCFVDPEGAEVAAEVVREAEDKLFDADPLALVVLGLACPACGADWRETLDVAGYVLHELGRQAQALLYDIHRLACAYGWTEGDVLALSPWRRRQYLAWAEA